MGGKCPKTPLRFLDLNLKSGAFFFSHMVHSPLRGEVSISISRNLAARLVLCLCVCLFCIKCVCFCFMLGNLCHQGSSIHNLAASLLSTQYTTRPGTHFPSVLCFVVRAYFAEANVLFCFLLEQVPLLCACPFASRTTLAPTPTSLRQGTAYCTNALPPRARPCIPPPPLLWWSCLRTEAGILCVLLSPATTTAPHAHAHHTTSACPSL